MPGSLQEFKTTKTERGMGVTCPRSDCGGRFIVREDAWLEGATFRAIAAGTPFAASDPGYLERRIKTRCCCYCGRVSLLPGEKEAYEGT